MATMTTTVRQVPSDHEALVERTVGLLAQRRKQRTLEDELTVRGEVPAAKRASAERPPAELATYQRLLEQIDRSLEGTIIGSDSRARIMAKASALGIRAFDASMMIALVQDRARRGESTATVPALLLAPTADHHLVTAAVRQRPESLRWMAVAATGLLVATLIAGWFIG